MKKCNFKTLETTKKVHFGKLVFEEHDEFRSSNGQHNSNKSKFILFRGVFLFFAVFYVICIFSKIYAVNITTMGLDNSLMNTYLAEDESENAEIKKIVDNFVLNFIRYDMTDFEKEMQIIKYLVATTTYDEKELYNDDLYINDSYKAYGALVSGKATCSGYAKAFDLLAKKCGLSSIVVTGTARNSNGTEAPHAWNQIYLDGEWYNVDVTWEDPNTNVDVGFNMLFNKYINGTEFEFSSNHERENGHLCTATKYGKKLVSYYLHTGVIDFNGNLDAIRKNYELQIANLTKDNKSEEIKITLDKLLLLGATYDDNSNLFFTSDDNLINQYILGKIQNGENVITIVTGANTENLLSIDKGDWLQNYITFQGTTYMNRYFSTDGVNDTRILIFSFENQH